LAFCRQLRATILIQRDAFTTGYIRQQTRCRCRESLRIERVIIADLPPSDNGVVEQECLKTASYSMFFIRYASLESRYPRRPAQR
jgi:hypothetical protein